MAGVPEALLWGLRRYLGAPQASITGIKRQPFAGGLSGSTLEYWHLNLRRAGVQASIALVYKRGAVVEGAFLRGAAQREALAYANLPGQIPIAMPTPIAFDIPNGDLWLLPFPPSKHTTHWLANWQRADAEKALADLAKLHASLWGNEAKLEGWAWLLRPTGADAARLLADGLAGLDALIADEAFDESLTAERVHQLRQLAQNPERLLDPLNTLPPTLLHGDAGFQNIAITQDGRQRLWYDWQLAAAGPAALDLVSFVHPWFYPEATLDFTLAELLDLYLAALSGRGIEIERAGFVRAVQAGLLWRWLLQWAPLLGLYRARLRPEVRQRLYAVFGGLHWPALDVFAG
ncbi:MAG: phosphotransferase [Caldilineales bacterium]|nr:phosphotransferase [Caldilineales bacterium]